MRTINAAGAAIALCVGLSACATVTRGTHTKYAIASTPSGAAVKTSTGFSCATTPCSLKLPRKEGFDATVSLAGYKSQTVHVKSEVRGGGAAGFAGNVVAGGLIGMAIDGSDGSMNDLVPASLNVSLVADEAPAPAADGAPALSPGAPATTPSTTPATAPVTPAATTSSER
jgi:hypothetical protein